MKLMLVIVLAQLVFIVHGMGDGGRMKKPSDNMKKYGDGKGKFQDVMADLLAQEACVDTELPDCEQKIPTCMMMLMRKMGKRGSDWEFSDDQLMECLELARPGPVNRVSWLDAKTLMSEVHCKKMPFPDCDRIAMQCMDTLEPEANMTDIVSACIPDITGDVPLGPVRLMMYIMSEVLSGRSSAMDLTECLFRSCFKVKGIELTEDDMLGSMERYLMYLASGNEVLQTALVNSLRTCDFPESLSEFDNVMKPKMCMLRVCIETLTEQ